MLQVAILGMYNPVKVSYKELFIQSTQVLLDQLHQVTMEVLYQILVFVG